MENMTCPQDTTEKRAKNKKSIFAIILSSIGILISIIFSIVGTSYSDGIFLPVIGICSILYFVTKIVSKKLALMILRIVGISICGVFLIFAFIGLSNGDSDASGSSLFFIFFALLFLIELLKNN